MKKITLKIYWSEKENDFVVSYPSSKSTGAYVLFHIIGKRSEYRRFGTKDSLWDSHEFEWVENNILFFKSDFIKEMEARGFDKKTLKFSIQIDANKIKTLFPEIYNNLLPEEKKKLKIE